MSSLLWSLPLLSEEEFAELLTVLAREVLILSLHSYIIHIKSQEEKEQITSSDGEDVISESMSYLTISFYFQFRLPSTEKFK